jgi:hypothetical protein
MIPDAQAATWMSTAQRRLLLALLCGAAALGLVSQAVPPAGALYWAALAGAGTVGPGLGWLLGSTAAGRRLDRLLLGRIGPPAAAWAPAHPAALEPATREALERAVLPVLMGQLQEAGRLSTAPAAVEALLVMARDILRQPAPPAREISLLVAGLPPIVAAAARKDRDVTAASALLQAALRSRVEEPDLTAQLEALLTMPASRGRRT